MEATKLEVQKYGIACRSNKRRGFGRIKYGLKFINAQTRWEVDHIKKNLNLAKISTKIVNFWLSIVLAVLDSAWVRDNRYP